MAPSLYIYKSYLYLLVDSSIRPYSSVRPLSDPSCIRPGLIGGFIRVLSYDNINISLGKVFVVAEYICRYSSLVVVEVYIYGISGRIERVRRLRSSCI